MTDTHERLKRAAIPVARERLRLAPPSEMYGIRAPIPPMYYPPPDRPPDAPVRSELNWSLVRDRPHHIGYVYPLDESLSAEIKVAMEQMIRSEDHIPDSELP